MSAIETDSRADDVELGIEDRQAVAPAMHLQPQVDTNGEANVVALGDLTAELTTLDASELLEDTMVVGVAQVRCEIGSRREKTLPRVVGVDRLVEPNFTSSA